MMSRKLQGWLVYVLDVSLMTWLFWIMFILLLLYLTLLVDYFGLKPQPLTNLIALYFIAFLKAM